ncbi:MAG: response regulator [Betaproteobacteria bacterium]|nr:response regulator [Betaproteobacteria bacterium]
MPKPASIRRSVTRVVLLTTATALLINAIALIALDIGAFRNAELADFQVQADMLARASAAAVAFNDVKEANRALRLFEQNPNLQAAAIYRADGRLFASYARKGASKPPPMANASGVDFERDRLRGFHTVHEDDGAVNTVYLHMNSLLYDRALRYLAILAAVMAGVLGIALFLAHRLQQSVTGPILVVADAAKQVVERRDYSVRVAPQPGTETGVLAEAFNYMLAALGDEIRERRHAESALREADSRKDRFLATLAHELRNPLAPIVTCFQLLRRYGGGDAAQERAHEVIDRQVRHMTRLLDDLLDVARITNDKVQLRKQRLTLASVIEAAVEATRPAIDRAGHKLSVAIPQEPLYIDGDAVRLAQVFANLLNNAAKYTNRGGMIALTAARKDTHAEVTVADQGIGIAAEDLPKIFSIFAQSDPARDRSEGGLGIGLFLVKALTELHGGAASVASAGLGRGSQFTVRLPLADVQGLELVAGTQIAPPESVPRRILIADDNRDAAESLATMLRLQGNDVQVALDGVEAMAIAHNYQPDTALLDIGMPGLTGYEVARRIRQAPWGRTMVLVAVTGWGAMDDRERAREAGFDHHLTKPARIEDIERILREEPMRRVAG